MSNPAAPGRRFPGGAVSVAGLGQQQRTVGHEKAHAVLDRVDVGDEVVGHDEVDQGNEVVHHRPRRKRCNQDGPQISIPCERRAITAWDMSATDVAFVQEAEDAVTDRLEGADHERTAGLGQLRRAPEDSAGGARP